MESHPTIRKIKKKIRIFFLFSEILIGRNSNIIVSVIKNFYTSKGADYNFFLLTKLSNHYGISMEVVWKLQFIQIRINF